MNELYRQARESPPDREALLRLLLRKAGVGRVQAPLIRRGTSEKNSPASFAQQRLLLLDQLEPGDPAYIIPFELDLAGALDQTALTAVLGEIMRRHEVLRTAYAIEADQAFQIVSEDCSIALPLVDLGELSQDARKNAVAQTRRSHAGQPFDLQHGPPIRFSLLRLGRQHHLLVGAIHHIAADASSMMILMQEIATLYAAFRDGLPSPLGKLPIQYTDYARAQRQSATGVGAARSLSYWRERLAGLSTGKLPVDRARTSQKNHRRGRRVPFFLAGSLSADISDLARREGVTPFMFMLAAFQLLLYRWTGGDDIAVGTPIGGRLRPQLENLIGLFVNPLVLRTDLSGNPTFLQLLHRTRETCLQAYAHQDLPFEKVVEAVRPAREVAHSPLFQSMLVMRPALDRIEVPGLVLTPAELEPEGAMVDLALYLTEGRQGISGNCEYAADLFERATIERFVAHYRVLIEEVVAAPERRVSEVEYLTAAERSQLLVDWTRTAADYPSNKCLHELFAAQAARTPDAVALVYEGQRLSYGELDAASNRLAHHLRALGVGPEIVVGLCAQRSLELVIGLLGVLKAGGAYLPLDPSYPAERIAYMLADARTPVLLTQDALREQLPPHDARVVLLDADWSAIAAEPAMPAPGIACPDNLAYVIYTSGSTGQPKGVMGSHRIVVNRIAAQDDIDPFTDTDIAIQKTSLSFVDAVFETFGPLLNGRPLVIVSQETGADAAALASALHEHGVTRLIVVPSLLRELLSLSSCGQSLRALRSVTVSGEAMDADVVRRFFDVLPKGRLINLYGSSEVAGDATGTQLSCGVSNAPIGRPLRNLQIYVLDAHLALAPIGIAGELYVGGVGLARGYRGRPDLTAERFVPSPFRDGERLYRTGDVGHWRADGALEFLGRTDHQVKLRGYRIELGEIEAALLRHEGVEQAVVVAREDAPGDKRLAAYVVGTLEDVPNASTLRTHLRRDLPGYMVPSAFVILGTLPLTPNGKVDRHALPAPEGRSDVDAHVAPRTPVEEALGAIWCEVLKLDRVGVTDNFFELGGHSLLAMRLVSLTSERLGRAVTLRSLFVAPTIAALADLLNSADTPILHREGDNASALPNRAARFEPFPLTEIQEAYWIGRRTTFTLGNVGAHSYFEMESADIDLARLTHALNQTIERQHMLRAIILPSGKQKVLSKVPRYEIATEDLTKTSERDAQARLLARRKRMSHAILDGERWPLFEVCACRLREGRVRLHVGFDMLIMDAWSYRIFLRDLAAFYRDDVPALPELAFGFRDYVCARVANAEGKREKKAEAYWRDRLPNLPNAPPLPFSKPFEAIEKPRFTRWSSRLEPSLWRRLQAQARSIGVTSATVLMAAFAEILATFSGSSHFILNLVVFDRAPLHPDVAGIVGDFTAMSVLEVDARENASFSDLARRIQNRVWQDLDHGAVSGIRVLRDMSRARGGMPVVVPVVFTSLLGVTTADVIREFPAELRLVDAITQTPQVALDCQVIEEDGSLSIAWDVVAALFHDGFVQTMFDAFVGRFRRLAEEDAAWSVTRSALIPAAQIETRRRANATDGPVADLLLDELFVLQAGRTPDAIAVATPALELTYADIERRSRVLASRLLERGDARGALVAVVMDKGWEQVAAVLGILRAGAAYLPIDPALPVERLHALLAHGEVTVALTQRGLAEALSWPENITRLIVDIADDTQAHLSLPPAPQRRTGELAYVIYTSGSTGMPKGVMIDHRGAVNTVLDVNRRFGMRPADRVLALSSLSFDLSVYDIFGPLAAGGAIVIPESWTRPDPAPWARMMLDRDVTIWNSVPALLEIYLQHLEAGHASLPAALRTVMISGDWIPINLPGRIKALKEDIVVVSLGGATEASIWSIYHPVERVEDHWSSIPYGRPLANQSVHVLDEALAPCPDWVTGEIYIGGIGLALGYWRDPEKTAERFIVLPQTQERLYRTGDLGRFLPDGEIEFLGRRDFQVKIQGHRVELGEIEATLLKHDSVANAVVTAEGADRLGKRLVAYVVPRPEQPVAPGALQAFLAAKLPGYMVPGAIAVMPALPLTANGKVDRKQLPAVAEEAERAAAPYAPPRDAIEQQIAQIWSQILGVERVGVHDNFFELGGHSVLAARAISMIREQLNVELPIAALFERPTIAGLIELKQQNARATGFHETQVALGLSPPGAAQMPVITDLAAREAFKERRLGLLPRDTSVSRIALLRSGEPEPERLLARRNSRRFADEPISLEDFGRLLQVLRSYRLGNGWKYNYASAGGLYPVQSYICAHDRAGCRGLPLPPGTYYYDPVNHELVPLMPDAQLSAGMHAMINQPVFRDAAFSLFLVAERRAIVPIYGAESMRFALIEAGMMAQLLDLAADSAGIGLCHTGGIDFEPHRAKFLLEDSQVLLHAYLGGKRSDNEIAEVLSGARESAWEESEILIEKL